MATAENTNEILSEATLEDGVGEDVTHIGLFTDSSAGIFLWGRAITSNVDAIALGEKYRIPPRDVVLTQNLDGGETEAMARRALNGRIEGTLYVSFHTGAPGLTGANESSEIGRVAISAWTVA